MVVQSPWPAPEIPFCDLTAFVLRHASRLVDTPALIDGPSGRELSYGALAAAVERAAGGLTARGFARGDVLALHLPNLPEFPIALHAGLRAGGVVTCASPLFTVPELADHLRRARARIVVTVGPLAETTQAAAEEAGTAEVLDLGELLHGGGKPPAVRPDPREIALLLPSSGTTGLPKLVELTHRALVANLVQTQILYPTGEGERLLGLAPFFHSMGLQCVLHHALSNGATVVTMARFEMEAMFRAMAEHSVTQALVAPPLLPALTHADVDLPALRMVGVGGAPVTAAQEAALSERRGVVVGQGYGMTEAGPLIAVAPLSEPARLRHGTTGAILPGTEVRIVDGEVWVRGPQLFSGYRDDPAATAATLDADGWLHTGDLGYVDESARITLTGRLKELIKVRGYQVAPAELEAVLTSHPAIADACVVGVPDEAAGERPKAWVVTRAPVDEAELHAYVEERVAPYKKLVAIEPIDELPRTMTGKLLRRVLLERERMEVSVSP